MRVSGLETIVITGGAGFLGSHLCKRRQVLGWKPEVGLADGLGRTIGWFRELAGGRA